MAHSSSNSATGDWYRSEQLWNQLYTTLTPTIQGWVYSSGVTSWQGQERDVVEDILQETVLRTFCYMQQAEQEGREEIRHINGFCKTVAYRHFVDLRRQALDVVRLETLDGMEIAIMATPAIQDPAEEVIERLSRISLLVTIGNIIAGFPTGQRIALLVDLAKRANLLDTDSPLMVAFTQVGIKLQDYLQYLPKNPLERGRKASLLSVAYKRLRETFQRRANNDCVDVA